MAVIKCKMCGGDLNLIPGESVVECEYCGSRQTVPSADNEKKLTLFARANRLRAGCEFDKAAGIYEAIVADFPEEAEAYWGLVLCKYGIEYVDDPATGKKIPTCHRSSFESILEDSDFEQAQENADVVARKQYREEAKQIEELRKGIIAVSANEQPYDIFICYKETDENGGRTLDSVLAQDIYDALTEKGYRVFFSRISLEDKLGTEYEPYIFAALNNAKIMLVVGTDYEYYNAVWVKNEWGRFLKLMAQDKTKHLIPCFKNLDAYDMPKEFAHLQAQDLGKVGAMQDLLRGIEKILPMGNRGQFYHQNQGDDVWNTESLLERGMLFLEDGEWEKADQYFEKILDITPKSAEAYLGKMMADLKVKTEAELETLDDPFDGNLFFEKIVRFADIPFKERISRYNTIISEKKNEYDYSAGLQQFKEATTNRNLSSIQRQQMYETAVCYFRSACGYKDADDLARSADEMAKRTAIERISLKRLEILPAQGMILADECETVGIHANGTAVSTSYSNACLRNLTNIKTIARLFPDYLVLKNDGTIEVIEVDGYGNVTYVTERHPWKSAVLSWTGITAISTSWKYSYTCVVGIKKDGTVVAAGDNCYGQCNVSGWTDVVAVSTSGACTYGVKSDGTVLFAGYASPNIGRWKNIIDTRSNDRLCVGLVSDGTVVVDFDSRGIQNESLIDAFQKAIDDVLQWKEIVAITVCGGHFFGVREDGTVITTNSKLAAELKSWNNIIAICAYYHPPGMDVPGLRFGKRFGFHVVGLKSDGTVISAGVFGEFCNVDEWKLFNSLNTLETEMRNPIKQVQRDAQTKAEDEKQEAKRIESQRAEWRKKNRCQYCGGMFRGFFRERCSKCSKPKDY